MFRIEVYLPVYSCCAALLCPAVLQPVPGMHKEVFMLIFTQYCNDRFVCVSIIYTKYVTLLAEHRNVYRVIFKAMHWMLYPDR